MDNVVVGNAWAAAARPAAKASESVMARMRNLLDPESAATRARVLGVQDGDFRGELALRTVAGAHPHALALHQLADAVAAQRLHVDEDVGRVGPARDEAVALAAVEPFHRRIERRPFRLGEITRGALCRHCGWRGGRVVQGDQTARLKPPRPLNCLAHNLGAFVGGLEARLPHAGLVQKHIPLHASRRFDETIALGEVEPFDLTSNFLCGFPNAGRSRYTRIHPVCPTRSMVKIRLTQSTRGVKSNRHTVVADRCASPYKT